jgi:hypothetical protein
MSESAGVPLTTRPPVSPLDRRASVRYRCPHPTPGRVFIAGSFQTVPAQVLNVSVGGLGLALGCRIEPGTVVFIEIHLSDSGPDLELAGSVAHTEQVPGGGWYCGCQFALDLTEDELRAILN